MQCSTEQSNEGTLKQKRAANVLLKTYFVLFFLTGEKLLWSHALSAKIRLLRGLNSWMLLGYVIVTMLCKLLSKNLNRHNRVIDNLYGFLVLIFRSSTTMPNCWPLFLFKFIRFQETQTISKFGNMQSFPQHILILN